MSLPALTPSEVNNNWREAHGDATAADATVNEPNGLATAAHRLLKTRGAEKLLVRMKYDDGDTVTTDPVIQVYGFDESSDALAWPLGEADGTHEVELTSAATDVSDGTHQYTAPVEILTKGARFVLVAIKTAADVAGDPPTVQMRAY